MKIKDEFGNLQEVQTISTGTIEAIISRNEMRCAIYQNVLDKENLVLISIGEPTEKPGGCLQDIKLSDEDVKDFKDSLRVAFWGDSITEGADQVDNSDAYVNRFIKLLQQKLGYRVTIANPFLQMGFSPQIDLKKIENDAPSLMVACGLALRSFD